MSRVFPNMGKCCFSAGKAGQLGLNGAGTAMPRAGFRGTRLSRPLIMKRIAAFSLATWAAAAILYFGQHSVALIALSGVVVLGGFDMLRP